jgi:hypothetical protein
VFRFSSDPVWLNELQRVRLFKLAGAGQVFEVAIVQNQRRLASPALSKNPASK